MAIMPQKEFFNAQAIGGILFAPSRHAVSSQRTSIYSDTERRNAGEATQEAFENLGAFDAFGRTAGRPFPERESDRGAVRLFVSSDGTRPTWP
jgi:hypothetical protein